jgi:hypothetical protein
MWIIPGTAEDPASSRQSGYRWRSGCQPYMPAALYSSETFSGTYFCSRLSKPQSHSAAERIRVAEKSDDLIRIRTRYLPACSLVPQQTMSYSVPY